MSRLVERDRNLLGSLGRYGVLSTHQIRDLHFPGVRMTTVLRRLRVLEKENLMKRIHVMANAMNVWALTPEGSRIGGVELPFRKANRNDVEHDVQLTEVRRSLEAVGIGQNWKAEHTIKQRLKEQVRDLRGRIIPDGVFNISSNGSERRIAVELELHLKAPSRYRKIFTAYGSSETMWLVWYIVPTASMGRILERHWSIQSDRKGTCGFAWSLLSEVLSDPLSAKVTQGRSQVAVGNLLSPPAHSDAQGMSGENPKRTNNNNPQAA